MLPEITLRPFTRDEFAAAAGLLQLAFLFEGRPEDGEVFAAGFEFDRSLGAFAGGRMVATAGSYSFALTVPGGGVPAAGVTIVTVHPAHRRRGILSAMMHRQLFDLHEHGEAVAVLRASEASIYGRFGYAPASRELALEIDRGPGTLRADPPVPAACALDLVPPDAARDRLAAVYDAVRPGVPGFLSRTEAAWTNVLYDPEHRRGGATALRVALVEDTGRAAGYALYRVKDGWSNGLPAGQVQVNELVATTPAAAAALWGHVLDVDLTSVAHVANVALDDLLPHLLADPRRARPRQRDGLWLRLVRLDEALAARRYAAPVDLVLQVSDARCPWNAGRWRLAADGTGAGCTPTPDRPDLTLDVTALAGGYLGDPVLAGYAAAGRIDEHRPGALRRLAAALSWVPAPWCTHDF